MAKAAFENVFSTIGREAMSYFMKHKDEEKDLDTLADEFAEDLKKGFNGPFKMKKRSSPGSSDLPPGRKRVHKRAEGEEACQAMTQNNTQCSRKHQDNSRFCKIHEKEYLQTSAATEANMSEDTADAPAPARAPAPSTGVRNPKKRPRSDGMRTVMKVLKKKKTAQEEAPVPEDSEEEEEEEIPRTSTSAFEVENVVSDEFTTMSVNGKEYYIDKDNIVYTKVDGGPVEVGVLCKDGKTINFNPESDDEDEEESDDEETCADGEEENFDDNMTF